MLFMSILVNKDHFRIEHYCFNWKVGSSTGVSWHIVVNCLVTVVIVLISDLYIFPASVWRVTHCSQLLLVQSSCLDKEMFITACKESHSHNKAGLAEDFIEAVKVEERCDGLEEFFRLYRGTIILCSDNSSPWILSLLPRENWNEYCQGQSWLEQRHWGGQKRNRKVLGKYFSFWFLLFIYHFPFQWRRSS